MHGVLTFHLTFVTKVVIVSNTAHSKSKLLCIKKGGIYK